MQNSLSEMASALVTQVESLVRVAELAEPKALLSLGGVTEKTARVRKDYVNACSHIEEQLRRALQQVKEKAPDPGLETRLGQAVDRLAQLRGDRMPRNSPLRPTSSGHSSRYGAAQASPARTLTGETDEFGAESQRETGRV